MSGNYSIEQRRQAYLKTKAGPADKVAMVLAALPALVVLVPLFIFLDNIIIIKIIGTIFGVIIYFILYSKISRPVFKHYYAKNSSLPSKTRNFSRSVSMMSSKTPSRFHFVK